MRITTGVFLGLVALTAGAAEHYGAPLTLKNPLTLEAAVLALGDRPAADVLVESTVKQVCEQRGCWIALQSASSKLHVTFKDPSSSFQRLRFKIYRDVPGIHRFMNIVRGIKERLMPMYEYDRERLMAMLSEHGCEVSSIKETDHGYLGGMIFFRKAADSK